MNALFLDLRPAAPSALLCAGCDYARRWRLPVTRRFVDCPPRPQ